MDIEIFNPNFKIHLFSLSVPMYTHYVLSILLNKLNITSHLYQMN